MVRLWLAPLCAALAAMPRVDRDPRVDRPWEAATVAPRRNGARAGATGPVSPSPRPPRPGTPGVVRDARRPRPVVEDRRERRDARRDAPRDRARAPPPREKVPGRAPRGPPDPEPARPPPRAPRPAAPLGKPVRAKRLPKPTTAAAAAKAALGVKEPKKPKKPKKPRAAAGPEPGPKPIRQNEAAKEERRLRCVRQGADRAPEISRRGACGAALAPARNGTARAVPPVLYSFPGSGNTWVRQLLEQASGAPTGSRYMDGEIAKVMPHECDVVETRDQCAGLVALKVHPTMAGYMEPRRSDGKVNFVGANPMCSGLVDRAIFLVRHPMAAFWSDWQRRKVNVDKHVGAIPLKAWRDELKRGWEDDARKKYAVRPRRGKRPKGAARGRFPLASAEFWTSDRPSERSG